MIGIALAAVFALAAMTASSAFAASEWLFEGATFTGELPVDWEGTLELINHQGGIVGDVIVDCSGLFEGTVSGGAGGAATITDAMDLSVPQMIAGTLDATDPNKTPISCEGLRICEGLVEVWGDNLNLELGSIWALKLDLEGMEATDYLVDFPTNSGYDMKCKTVIGTQENLCEGLVSELLTNEVGGVLAEFLGEDGFTCTMGVGLIIGGSLMAHTGGGTISVSG